MTKAAAARRALLAAVAITLAALVVVATVRGQDTPDPALDSDTAALAAALSLALADLDVAYTERDAALAAQAQAEAEADRTARKLDKARVRVHRLDRQVKRWRGLFGVASRIDRTLAEHWPGSPLQGHGVAFVREGLLRPGRKLNPVAVVSISGVESTFGQAPCVGTGNAWGLGACGRAWSAVQLCGKTWPLRYASTFDRGIRLTTQLVRCLWPNAQTVYDLHGYCSGCPTWGSEVAGIMRTFGSGPNVTA